MSKHPADCACVNCNPVACRLCGMASPGGTHLRFSTDVCSHRKACEGRQLLRAGAPVDEAVAVAQRGGVASELTDEWPFEDDPPDPL